MTASEQHRAQLRCVKRNGATSLWQTRAQCEKKSPDDADNIVDRMGPSGHTGTTTTTTTDGRRKPSPWPRWPAGAEEHGCPHDHNLRTLGYRQMSTRCRLRCQPFYSILFKLFQSES
uniref:Uncharacterized protein n=1 Tax=Physcomitrium patens TaxID=3218 RepID=A0A2K1L898_PHYPA|nr:hypothetical protein PHYPA_000683 [Physcomitrium patens]